MRQLLDEEQLREGVGRLAEEINGHYQGRPLTIIGVLTGSVVLLADLIRLLDMPLKVGLVQATSYRGATTPGELELNLDLLPDIAGRQVLIVDDIFDTGHTLAALVEKFMALGPAQLRSAVLLRKAGRVEVPLQPDHVGFEIPNEFVVGYGLDYADLYRNLPHVAALDPEDLSPQHGQKQSAAASGENGS
ncbi:MAG TPA: hypoxanthine phosphoribosyltransferase [Pirellulales bacterium]|nr:hypoxanthine phosphoribosyltransferase [Pirellulales bacterium]